MKNFKKLLFTILSVFILFACNKESETKEISKNGISSVSNLWGPEDGTPYSQVDIPTHRFTIGIYRADVPLMNSKWLTQYIDSSSVHHYNGHIYLDSLGKGFLWGNGKYYLSVDSATNRVGVSKIPVAISYTAGNGISISPTGVISVNAPTINNSPGRTLNSNFTISTTKTANVVYAVTCTVTNPLLIGSSSATATLQYSTNGGSTWINLPASGSSSSVGVAVAIQLTNGQTGVLVGSIPANALVRISTTTTGTASVTASTQQETIY